MKKSDKLGYSIASTGDAIAYTFIGTFLMFFLTTVAKIDPAKAGVISAVGAIWNAIFNPFMGYFSDKVRTRFGKRRPVMLAFSIPLGVSLFLLYTVVPLPETLKAIYYGLILMLFWTSYTGFFVPYLALGAEYTTNYDDRIVLRLYASFFNMMGILICMFSPTLLIDFLKSKGMETSHAWSLTAGMLGLIIMSVIFITVHLSKSKDLPCSKADAPTKDDSNGILSIFKEYIAVAKLKPMIYLTIASLASLICYAILMSDMLYFMTYNLRFSPKLIAFLLLTRPLIAVAFIPLVGRIAIKTDKRLAIIAFYSLGIALMVLLHFIGIESKFTIALYVLALMLCTCIYWQLMPAIYYDVCDYDQLHSGKSRQGTIVSFQGLIEAVAVGAGSLILGTLLKVSGFDGNANMQNAETLARIESSTTIIPVMFLAVAAISIYLYPITKRAHEEILSDLAKKDKKN